MDGSHSFPVVIVMRSIYNGDFNMTETLSWLLAETRLQAKKNMLLENTKRFARHWWPWYGIAGFDWLVPSAWCSPRRPWPPYCWRQSRPIFPKGSLQYNPYLYGIIWTNWTYQLVLVVLDSCVRVPFLLEFPSAKETQTARWSRSTASTTSVKTSEWMKDSVQVFLSL